MIIHDRGTMDRWNPAAIDGLAQGREMILFDNAGVGASSGEVPAGFSEMSTDAIAFIQGGRAQRGRRSRVLDRHASVDGGSKL